MPKPVCVKCRCFYKPKTNSYAFVEGMPNRGDGDPSRNIRGHRAPEMWSPYKLWMGDLWECPDCRAQIIVGFGQGPISEHYLPNFKEQVEHFEATIQINDC